LEFHYQVRWRSSSARPGHHRSQQTGGGFEFAGHVPFVTEPDPRNLDVHATLHDPFGQLMVRRFRQRSAIPVFVLADLSASMGFIGRARKLGVLIEFTAAVAYSAYRSGDPFGFFAGDEAICQDLCLPLRWYRGPPLEFLERLEHFRPTGRTAEGLGAVVAELGRARALVFLVSDFHAPESWWEGLFDALRGHDVVPVVLWDTAEYRDLPEWGVLSLRDPETGRARRLVLRPSLKRRWRERFEAKRAWLVELGIRHGRAPFFLENGFDADALTRYFLET
jgi:uncharacterized protein (DUF58 family)